MYIITYNYTKCIDAILADKVYTNKELSALQEYLHFDVMTDDAIIILLALEHTIWFILA